MRTATSTIVDQYGNPIRYHFFEGAKKPYGDTGFYGSRVTASDTQKLLGQFGWEALMRNGRFLFANVPMVRGAFIEKANHAFPLEPQYAGKNDSEWGDLATEWLWNWDNACTIRGAPYDQATCSRVRMLGRGMDGDILTIMTEDPDSQYPKTQLVRSHRVGSRRLFVKESEPLKEGPWKGNFISNGVVFDRVGRCKGFRVLGSTEGEDSWIPSSAGRLDYRPDYSDQSRGFSELVAAINSLDDLKRLNEYEMRAQNAMASIAIIEKNETGFADETSDRINRAAESLDSDGDGQKDVPPLITESYESGSVRYFRSGTGSGLEAFRGDRPSADAAAFEERIVRRAMYGIEWDADFALALKSPGGAWARTILQKVNRVIANTQAVEAATLWWIHTRALARAVYDLKVLRPPSDGDIFSWNYRGPAKITADSGNDANAKRSDYVLGTRTLQDDAGERGKWWKEVRKQREAEVKDKLSRARNLLSEFPELMTIQNALKLIEDTNPNTAPAAQIADAVASSIDGQQSN